MPRHGDMIYWLRMGDWKVRPYRPGQSPQENAPTQDALVFKTREQANAIVALVECHRFILKFLERSAFDDSVLHDDERWVNGVAAKDGDPLPMVKNWLANALSAALTSWEQEQREQVMAALAGLEATSDDGLPDDAEDLPF